MNDLRETYARIAHEAWSGWMNYLFSKSSFPSMTIPLELVMRWHRQMNTDYDELTEEEKESDRKEADKYLTAMNDEAERLEDIITQISEWCRAYPIEAFPEPDFKKAAGVLKAEGMTLDAISASNMRHVLNGIKRIIDGTEQTE